ncbi:FKBP-type peptidyl-prolyl cis-trans isomerase [Sedimenticola hydrogenitrophicus]|uniref:FKBP-type peptidyl-prolyl cis-trans isomerase n=1 Tax=Sedimenticola hydrogenitrophicus TaxID=2967975 RepID=UPI0023B152E2|nr:FKBP-type peptidyl-prolyl cis-trans isomerase [Sedimenticola hydrogenitrophicus]
MSVSIKPIITAAVLATAALSVQAAELTSLEQRFSYALGYQFAQQLQQQGVKVEGAAFGAALDDVLGGKTTQLTPQQMSEAFQQTKEAMAKAQEQKSIAAKQAGEEFLAENSKQEGVVVLPSGLQYQVLQAGTGEKPAAGSTVTVHYRGTLISGEEFDSSYARGEPASFSLNGVIPGFREGISQMNQGAKWKLVIPASLGYGETGAPGAIGPNETLIFEVELLSFEAPNALPESQEEKKGE